MENQYGYEYLGFALFSTLEEMTTTPLLINISPRILDKFLLSTHFETRVQIHTANTILPAICDFKGEHGITSFLQSINLSCDYLYYLTFRGKYNNDLFYQTELTPIDFLSFFNSSSSSSNPYQLVSSSIAFFTLRMLEFVPFEYYHQVGVDIEVSYRWEQNSNSPSKILHLRLQQEPTPMMPIGPKKIPIRWELLGYDVLDHTKRFFNKLEFVYYFNVMFLVSFPETTTKTRRMRDRFHNGFGVRATNVYTPGKTLHGLQLKMDCSQPYVVTLFLGSVLLFNSEFFGKKILVYYCWTSNCLELAMIID